MYTLNTSRNITRSLEDLEREILEIQNSLESVRDRERIKVLKNKNKVLDDLLGIRAQGALVRSRFQSAAQMNGPTKFFFGLEKKNGLNKMMHSLLLESGTEITEPKEIRKRAVAFYSELYRSEYTEVEEIASCFYEGLPKVPEGANTEL